MTRRQRFDRNMIAGIVIVVIIFILFVRATP